jgi:hypothetical protein
MGIGHTLHHYNTPKLYKCTYDDWIINGQYDLKAGQWCRLGWTFNGTVTVNVTIFLLSLMPSFAKNGVKGC